MIETTFILRFVVQHSSSNDNMELISLGSNFHPFLHERITQNWSSCHFILTVFPDFSKNHRNLKINCIKLQESVLIFCITNHSLAFVCVCACVFEACVRLTVMLSNSAAMCLMMSLCCKGCVWSSFLMTTTLSATTVSERQTKVPLRLWNWTVFPLSLSNRKPTNAHPWKVPKPPQLQIWRTSCFTPKLCQIIQLLATLRRNLISTVCTNPNPIHSSWP